MCAREPARSENAQGGHYQRGKYCVLGRKTAQMHLDAHALHGIHHKEGAVAQARGSGDLAAEVNVAG